jgi:sugar phosphate isomerase/epimerase
VQQAVLLGTGVTPFSTLFARLRQSGWDGWVCMEEYARLGREGVELAAEFIRRAWSEA